jgi:hypothetical protein
MSAIDKLLKQIPQSAYSKQTAPLSAIDNLLAEKRTIPTNIVATESPTGLFWQQAQPQPVKKEGILQKIGKLLLPKSLEVKFGLTEPTMRETMLEQENARASYLRQQQTKAVFEREKVSEAKIPATYKEPTTPAGQFIEGTKLGIEVMKSTPGYFAEAMGRLAGSPEMIQWGQNYGDTKTAELLKKPELFRPAEIEKFPGLNKDLINYAARSMGEQIPIWTTMIASATLGGLIAGPTGSAFSVAGATVGGFGSVYALEQSNAYKDMLDKGVNPQDAALASQVYGAISSVIENAFGYSPTKIGQTLITGSAKKTVFSSFKSFLLTELPKISKTVLIKSFQEGGEEAAQQLTQNLITKWYDSSQPVWENIKEGAIQGFIGSLPMGGTDVISSLRQTTIEARLIKELIDRGMEVGEARIRAEELARDALLAAKETEGGIQEKYETFVETIQNGLKGIDTSKANIETPVEPKKITTYPNGVMVVDNSETIEIRTPAEMAIKKTINEIADKEYIKVQALGNDINGNPISARYEPNYKTGKGTIYYTSESDIGQIAHEIGHKIDHELSANINKRLSEMILDYSVNEKAIQQSLHEFAIMTLSESTDKIVQKDIVNEVKRIAKALPEEVKAMTPEDKGKYDHERWANATRKVATNPAQTIAIAPLFTKFMQYYLAKTGLVKKVMAKIKRGVISSQEARKIAIKIAPADIEKASIKTVEARLIKELIDRGMEVGEARIRAEELARDALLAAKETEGGIQEKYETFVETIQNGLKGIDTSEKEVKAPVKTAPAGKEGVKEAVSAKKGIIAPDRAKAEEYLAKRGVKKFRKVEKQTETTKEDSFKVAEKLGFKDWVKETRKEPDADMSIFWAKTEKPGVYYHVGPEEIKSKFDKRKTEYDISLRQGVSLINGMYLGKDVGALKDFYGMDADVYVTKGYGEPKWMNLMKRADEEKFYKDVEKKYGVKEIQKEKFAQSMEKEILDRGYDGVKYFDPWATGEEYLLIKTDALSRNKSGAEKFRIQEELTTKVLNKLTGRTKVSKQFISDLTNAPDLKQAERDVIRNVLDSYGTKEIKPLAQEARKYKSAEEFVKAQHETTYRGASKAEWESIQKTGKVQEKSGTRLIDKKTGKEISYGKEEGVNTSPDKRLADLYGNGVGQDGVVIEFKPEAKGKMNFSAKFDSTDLKADEYLGKNLTLDDVAKVTDKNGKIIYEAKDIGKTKSQLTDFYNQLDAQKGDQINVPEFIEKVKQELLPLKITKATASKRWENIALPNELRGNIANYTEHVYQSPIPTSAHNTHFRDLSPMGAELGGKENAYKTGYFGHTRIEDLATMSPKEYVQKLQKGLKEGEDIRGWGYKGETRRVIEVQSDLYQKGGIEKAKKQAKQMSDAEFEKVIAQARKEGKTIDQFMDEKTRKLEQYNDPTAHFRMLREEIKQAAIDGKTKLQFPTGETAMKIEGLGVANNWRQSINGSFAGNILKPEDLKIGKLIDNSGSLDETTNRGWIITDILGDGKFKAVQKGLRQDVSQGLHNIKEFDVSKSLENIPESAKETFDISGKVDTNNPIYRFYEKDLGRYLKSKYNAQQVTDGKGVTWYEVNITPAMKGPVEAFRPSQDFADLGIKITPEQETKITSLNKKIFGDEDIKITEQILTPEGQKALGSYRDSMIKILEGQASAVDTYYHEAVHKYFDLFTTGAEQVDLLLAGKKKYGLDDFAIIEEKIAEDFINYAKSRTGVTGAIRLAFDKILYRIKKYLGNTEEIAVLYNDILIGKATEGQVAKKITVTVPRSRFIAGTVLETGRTVKGRLGYNPDKINAPEDVSALLGQVYKEGGEFVGQRISKTDANLRALAVEVGVTPEHLLKVRPGSIANAETVLKARQIGLDLAQDLRDNIRYLRNKESVTKEDMKTLKKKVMTLIGVAKTNAGLRTESSNVFRQNRIEVMPGENDIWQDVLGELGKIDQKSAGDLSQFVSLVNKELSPQIITKLVVKKRGGKPLTETEARILGEKAGRVSSLEGKANGLSDMLNNKEGVLEYLTAVSDLRIYVQSLNPAHVLRVMTELIGRATMLFSIKSPLLNIESNTLQGLMQVIEKRIANKQIKGIASGRITEYMKFAVKVFDKTGIDITRMIDAADARSGIKKVLGETRISAAGPGPIRAVGRFYEKWIFRRTLGVPDVVASSFHAADTANLGATLIARSEGLAGEAAKARADELFNDTLSLTPKTPEGAILRKQAILDAEYATWQNKSRASDVSLKIRDAINTATGDLRLGDLNIPFAKTPANVISAGIETAGGGLFSGLYKIKKAFSDKTLNAIDRQNVVKSATRSFIRAGIGLTVAMVIASLLDEDDYIGIYALDAKERRIQQMSGGGENMIRIGGKWVSLEYFGALGVPIAGIMSARKYGSGSILDKAFRYIQGTGTQILRLPGINEVRNMITKITTDLSLGMTPGEMLEETKNDILGMIKSRTIPGIVNDIANATDETMRETSGNIFAQIQAGIPGVREGLPVRLTVLGEEVPTTGAGQLFFGARIKEDQDSPLKVFLAENRLSISVPSKTTKIKVSGFPEGRQMTASEYYNYVKYSGEKIKIRLEQRLESLKRIKDIEITQEEINKIVNDERENAKNRVTSEARKSSSTGRKKVSTSIEDMIGDLLKKQLV